MCHTRNGNWTLLPNWYNCGCVLQAVKYLRLAYPVQFCTKKLISLQIVKNQIHNGYVAVFLSDKALSFRGHISSSKWTVVQLIGCLLFNIHAGWYVHFRALHRIIIQTLLYFIWNAAKWSLAYPHFKFLVKNQKKNL